MSGLLDGKVAVVTGAAHGVGRGHALELARHGARVVVNDMGGSVSGQGGGRAADAVVKLIEANGGVAVADYGDVGDEGDVQELVDRAYSAWGRLDVVVNNAGILRDAPIWDMPVEDFDAVLRVHVRGSWLVCRAAIRRWRDQFGRTGGPIGGRIINTTSGVGMAGNRNESNYCAAKAGIIGLTYALNLEVAPLGVTCNAIGPSGNTRMSATSQTSSGDHAPIEPDYGPRPWRVNDPANSAPLVAWLASDQSAHVSGQVFRVPGDRIALMSGWREGPRVEANRQRWDAATLGERLAEEIFGTRHAGWPSALEPRS